MNSRIDQLVKTLLQKDSIEQCSLRELEDYAARHPYFGAAQLLLTKKLQEQQAAGYEEQFQRTLLFFHNPLWVEHLLNENGTARIENGVNKLRVAEEPNRVEKTEVPHRFIVADKEPEPLIEMEEQEKELQAENQEPSKIDEVDDHRAEVPNGAVINSPVQAEPIPEQTVSIKPPAASEPGLTFEPYHTVDYFASQGIKFKEEEKPVDKFGQQLKSFTEWLKTMKRLPATEIAAATPAVAEKKVEELAETSLQDRAVITEAMAEVWEKQGNIEKAIDIYRKLSLLEPSKSAYFAAKIEDLKK